MSFMYIIHKVDAHRVLAQEIDYRYLQHVRVGQIPLAHFIASLEEKNTNAQ